VAGRVTAGPTCPVEQVGHPCPPQPVSATIKAQQARRTVTRTQSDSDGRYAMRLAPGRYTLVVQTGSQFPRCPTTPVTVPRNQVVTVDISCDTGIR
jgi:5-hydroxyisourate hydrolase-like protein (transthyretin family)